METVSVLIPLRDSFNARFDRLSSFIRATSLGEYYKVFYSKDLYISVKSVVEKKNNSPLLWNSLLKSKEKEWSMLHILLAERVRFSPRPSIKELKVDNSIHLNLGLDGADTTLLSTVYSLVCNITDTNPVQFLPTLVLGTVKKSIPENKVETLKADINRVLEEINRLFEGDNMLLSFGNCGLYQTYDDHSFSPWNGRLPDTPPEILPIIKEAEEEKVPTVVSEDKVENEEEEAVSLD